MIEVIKPGTEVSLRVLGKTSIQGTTTAVCLRGTTLTYEVNWWDELTVKTSWFAEAEIDAEPYVRTTLGFR